MDLAYNMFYSSLKTIEKIWLPRNSTKKYMFGDQPTIADLSLAFELQQFEGIDFQNTHLKTEFPSIYQWMYVDMMEIDGFKKIWTKGNGLVTKILGILNKKLYGGKTNNKAKM